MHNQPLFRWLNGAWLQVVELLDTLMVDVFLRKAPLICAANYNKPWENNIYTTEDLVNPSSSNQIQKLYTGAFRC